MNTILSLVTGGSASGKTTIAKEIEDELNRLNIETLLISQDDYYICPLTDVLIEDLSNYDFDKPYAVDTKHLFSDITNLLKGESVMLPKYHFGTEPKNYNHRNSGNPKIILLEGNFVLYYQYLVNLAKMSIFVDVDEEIRLERRINRDIIEREISREETIKRFNKFVKPSHDKYIQPSITNANHIIKNNQYDLIEIIKKIKD